MKATTPKGREVELVQDGGQDRISVYYDTILVARQVQGVSDALVAADRTIDSCNLRK